MVNEIVPSTLMLITDTSTSRSLSNDKPSCKMPALFTRKSICNEKEHVIFTSTPSYIVQAEYGVLDGATQFIKSSQVGYTSDT